MDTLTLIIIILGSFGLLFLLVIFSIAIFILKKKMKEERINKSIHLN